MYSGPVWPGRRHASSESHKRQASRLQSTQTQCGDVFVQLEVPTHLVANGAGELLFAFGVDEGVLRERRLVGERLVAVAAGVVVFVVQEHVLVEILARLECN